MVELLSKHNDACRSRAIRSRSEEVEEEEEDKEEEGGEGKRMENN